MIQNYFGWLNMTHDDPYQYDNLKYGLMIFNPTKIIKKTSTLTSWIQDQLRSLAVHVKALSLAKLITAVMVWTPGWFLWSWRRWGGRRRWSKWGSSWLSEGRPLHLLSFATFLQSTVDNAQLTIIWQSFWQRSVEKAWSDVRDQLLHQNSENWGNTRRFSSLLSV